MADLFHDSFDTYTTLLEKWSQSAGYGGGGTNVVIGAGGRNGTNKLLISNSWLSKTLGAPKTTLIMGTAWQQAGSVFDNNNNVIQFADATGEQISLRTDNLGHLKVHRGATLLATGTTVLQTNVYYYIEFKATIDAAAGAYTVRINSVVETALNATGVNTKNQAGSSQIAQVLIGGFATNVASYTAMYYDDVYICDTLGARNNDFLGDIRVFASMATAVGNYSGWTPNAAGANYTKVNEIPHDGATTNVSTSTVGTRDTYVMADLPISAGTILAVQTVLVASKDDAGARSIQPVMRQGATDADLGSAANLSQGYTTYLGIAEVNPVTGNPFTIAEINALEAGMRLAS